MSGPTPPREEPGWLGGFTRDQADGAILNGHRFIKVDEEEGDGHALGDTGTILGSWPIPDDVPVDTKGSRHWYWVEFDNSPRIAVGVMGWKIAELHVE